MPGLDQLKPASSIRSRLLVAALIWTLVGAALLAAGLRWTLAGEGLRGWVALVPAVGLGWLKSRYLLSRRADANAQRIVDSGESRCLGGVFAWSAWGLVAAMIALGAAMRLSSLPRLWLGVLYVTVGSALLIASTVSWRRWRSAG